MKILILGATGMLGYSLFTCLSERPELSVFGSVRSIRGKEHFFNGLKGNIVENIDANNINSLNRLIEDLSPDVLINCIGLIKQQDASKKYKDAIKINSLLPHELAEICDKNSTKLIHFSTDCVFDGSKGNYNEDDMPNAYDIYGRSKFLGEVNYGNHLTLRTSIIGHELDSNVSLIDWFLKQDKEIKGYKNAIFSGLPTVYIAEIIYKNLKKLIDINGMYHLSVEPISKYDLLSMVSSFYKKEIEIKKDEAFSIDRSLDSLRLKDKIDLEIKSWPEIIDIMHNDYLNKYVKRRSDAVISK